MKRLIMMLAAVAVSLNACDVTDCLAEEKQRLIVVQGGQQSPPPYWIGVGIDSLSDTLKSQLELESGIVVNMVSEDSPAKKAGIQTHDILLQFNTTQLDSPQTLIEAVGKTKGEASKLTLLRKGRKKTLDIKPEKRPEGSQTELRLEAGDGVSLNALELQIREALKGNGRQRLLFIGPSLFDEGAKMMPQIKSKLDGEQGILSLNINGQEFKIDSLEQLPPQVRKLLDGRVLKLDRANELRLRLRAEDIKKLEGEASKIRQQKAAHSSGADSDDEIVKALRDLRKQMDALRKDVNSLKNAKN